MKSAIFTKPLTKYKLYAIIIAISNTTSNIHHHYKKELIMEVNKEGTVEGSLNKPVLRYWFYAYSYSNYQGFGYGNGTLSSSHNFFPSICHRGYKK